MTSQPQKLNPFYFLLVITGVVFAITACSYGVMTVTFLEPTATPSALLTFLDQHGFQLMLVELGALFLFCVAAMALDVLRDRQLNPQQSQPLVTDQATPTDGDAAVSTDEETLT